MKRFVLTAIVLAALGALAIAASASAGQAFQEKVHFEDEHVDADFCDEGLNVRVSLVIDSRVHIVPHGPDGLEYYLETGTWDQVITNLANGKSVTSHGRETRKDHIITENGDGSLTIVFLVTGNVVTYGADGKAIARNPGQLRFELIVYPDGTEVRGDTVKGSTGRSDDFCDAVVAALS